MSDKKCAPTFDWRFAVDTAVIITSQNPNWVSIKNTPRSRN